MKNSVKSINQCQSPDWIGTGLFQTSYDFVKPHGGVPITIGMKVETKDGAGTTFTIVLTGT